jgi:hypothetical protein
MRFLNPGFLVFLSIPRIGVGQDSVQIKGLPLPTAVHATPIGDGSLTRLLNSIKVETDGAAGIPMLNVRILSTWGQYSGQDCDCLTTRLFVVVTADEESKAFRLPELLEPSVEPLLTEDKKPVVYVNYGLPSARRRVRLEISMSGVRIRAAPPTR